MKEYNKNDNDSYVEKYSDIPSRDVEIHMYKSEDGHISSISNSFIGNFSVESGISASNNVLHFPKASNVQSNGFSEIKRKKISTLYPMSLIQRYNIEENDLEYSQVTPIYFDAKLEKFIVLLDYRFSRDIEISELGFIKGLLIYKDKKDKSISYVGISYDSISEISNKNDVFEKLKDAYINYNMTLQKGEKVIIVRTKLLDDDKISIFRNNEVNLSQYLGKYIFSTSFNFEFSIAIRFKNRYYLVDEEGRIIRNSSFFINKEEVQKLGNNIELSVRNKVLNERIVNIYDEEHQSLFISSYSDEQFDIITRIKSRINEIHRDLSQFFKDNSNNSNDLDESITRLENKEKVKKISYFLE